MAQESLRQKAEEVHLNQIFSNYDEESKMGNDQDLCSDDSKSSDPIEN